MSRARARVPLLVLAFACGCRPAPSSPATAPTAVPDTARGGKTPEYLQVDVDPAKHFPQHVQLVRLGVVRFERDGAAINDAENRTAAIDARLLDADEYGTPSRPRVLCEGARSRVAVYVDREDLAWVVARTVSLTATPRTDAPAPRSDEPGVQLRSGTAVRLEGSGEGEVARVRYERPGVRVAGFVRRADLGIGFLPEPVAPDGRIPDAKLVQPATFHAIPGGQVVGEVDPRFAMGFVGVHTIGAARGGEQLVRYGNADMQLVGWVPTAVIERGAVAGPSTMVRGPGLDAVVEGAPLVDLKRGTVLRGGPLRDALGVVTEDGAFSCTGDCDGEHPKIAVPACTTIVELLAG